MAAWQPDQQCTPRDVPRTSDVLMPQIGFGMDTLYNVIMCFLVAMMLFSLTAR